MRALAELEQAYRARLDAWPRGRALPAGAARGPVDARGAAVSQFAQGLGTRGPVSREADPPGAGRGRLKAGLLGREGCAAAAARASRRPPTGWAASAGCSPRASSAATGGGRPSSRSCCCSPCSPARPAPATCCWRARPRADRRQEAVERFAAAWEKRRLPRDVAADLARAPPRLAAARSSPPATGSPPSRRPSSRSRCASGAEPVDGSAPRPRARAHARLRRAARHRAAARSSSATASPTWTGRRAWRLPGLRDGENVRRRVLERPARRPILAADGSRLEAEPTMAPIIGTPPAGGEPGSGLQALYDQRLGGRPGAELRFGKRLDQARRRQARPRAAHHALAAACSASPPNALGGRLGGVAVIRPRTGRVLAHGRHRRVSGPQPPGSTFKIITLSGALQARDREPVERLSGADRRRRSPACGGEREQRVLRRLAREPRSRTRATRCSRRSGAKLGRKRLVRLAEAFGFNEKPRLPTEKPSTIARDLKDDLAVGSAAIGQERDLATAVQMASVGATIANRGVRMRPRVVASERGAPPARRLAPGRRAGARHDARRRPRRHRQQGRAARRRGGRQDRHRRAAPRRAAARSTRRTPTPGSSRSRPPTTRRSRSP